MTRFVYKSEALCFNVKTGLRMVPDVKSFKALSSKAAVKNIFFEFKTSDY